MSDRKINYFINNGGSNKLRGKNEFEKENISNVNLKELKKQLKKEIPRLCNIDFKIWKDQNNKKVLMQCLTNNNEFYGYEYEIDIHNKTLIPNIL